MFQPIVAPKPTNKKLVAPTVTSPLTLIDDDGKENISTSNTRHLTYDYKSKDFVHTISKGIKTNKVSDADLLSISIISSAKKRKLYGIDTISNETSNNALPSSYSAFSKPTFDFRNGGSLHDTEEEDIEQDRMVEYFKSMIEHSSSSMQTSPIQVNSNSNEPTHAAISSSYNHNNNHDDNYSNDNNESYDEKDSSQDMHIDETHYDPTITNPNTTTTNAVTTSNDNYTHEDDTSENWTQLRAKVGQAVMYQLLHLLNHGTIEEVCKHCF